MSDKNASPIYTVNVGVAATDAEALDSLDGIDTNFIDTGVFGWVKTGPAANRLFRFDAASVTPPNGTTVIQPRVGPGRWLEFAASPVAPTTLQGAAKGTQPPGTTQNISGAAFVPVDDGSGSPLTALLASGVQPNSILRFGFMAGATHQNTQGSPPTDGALSWRMFATFPDDAIPDILVSGADMGTQYSQVFQTTTVNFHQMLYPNAATVAFGGPATGRVGVRIDVADAKLGANGDAFRISEFPFSFTNWGAHYISVEELDGSVYTIQ